MPINGMGGLGGGTHCCRQESRPEKVYGLPFSSALHMHVKNVSVARARRVKKIVCVRMCARAEGRTHDCD